MLSVFLFQAARKAIGGFAITSRGISEFIFRIRKIAESSFNFTRSDWFSITNC